MEPSHLPCSSLTHPAAILTPSIGVLRWIRAKGKDRVQIDLIISALNLPADGTKLSKKERPGTLDSTLGIVRDALAKSDFQVDSFFDVMYVANIGSS